MKTMSRCWYCHTRLVGQNEKDHRYGCPLLDQEEHDNDPLVRAAACRAEMDLQR